MRRRVGLGLVAAVIAAVSSCRSGPIRATPPTPTTATTGSLRPRPVAPVMRAPAARPTGIVFHGRRDLPLVALTFDSNLTVGMERELDQHRVVSFDNVGVIDELDQMQVPATFFLTGLWIERYRDTARRLANDPLFEIASHSYAHRAFAPHCYDLGPVLPDALQVADIEHSEAVLHGLTARPTPYFRFPGGCYTPAALRAASTAAVLVVQYDLPSGDAFGHSVRAIVANVLNSARDGSIIVMHITGGNTAPLTADALPSIVTGLRARGFRLVRVSDLLAA